MACSFHYGEEMEIAGHACGKYTGRVGRSAAAKQLNPCAVQLTVIAHIRHAHTRYDDLLGSGYDRRETRELVSEEIDEVLEKWG